MRTLVYTDYAYHRVGDAVLSERAFSLFLARVADQLDGTVVVAGRLSPSPEGGHYPIGDRVEFLPLRWYDSLIEPRAIVALVRSLGVCWRAIGEVDTVWLLGPHPLIVAMAAFTIARRRRLILGVRQDFSTYIASRRPNRSLVKAAARALEASFRALGRRCDVIVVGPELARNYARARRLLEIPVSLVGASQIVDRSVALGRDYSTGPLRVLSVGRLDAEKNPLLLADALERLRASGADWRLEVCGEGPLAGELARRLGDLGLSGCADLAGYVPFDRGLVDRYRSAHVLVHSSWTEGLPQVLLEAFAAGLPVVASDVGGIADAVGDAVCLVPPGDAKAAADAVARIASDTIFRTALIDRGLAYVRAHTVEIETRRVAEFISPAGGPPV